MTGDNECQVLIAGAGPCGVTIANLLGTYGVRTLVVDRSPEIINFPRAVGIDDESLRAFQACGLADDVHSDMIQDQPLRWFDDNGKPLAAIQPAARPYGWPRRNSFLQPILETKLRAGLGRFEHVRLLSGTEVDSLSQGPDGVNVQLRDLDGTRSVVRADYVVGADGGRSTVRKLIGATMVGSTHAARWLVVDIEESPLHAPFSGTYISRKRPRMSIDLPYGYRRFEFRLGDDEPDEMMLRHESIEALIREHYDWQGPIPSLERSRIYVHHSRLADKFQQDRVFLAGDAAHLQPPWFGQGLNSGIRDAFNIAWKLAAVLNYGAPPSLLVSYGQERRGHAAAMVGLASTLGKLYAPRTRTGETLRYAVLRTTKRIPGLRDYIPQMKFKPMPFYESGIVLNGEAGADPKSGVGRMFVQPLVEDQKGDRLRLDDAIGDWFAVIGFNADPQEFLDEEAKAYWRSLGATFLKVHRSRPAARLRQAAEGTVVLDDVEGGLRNWVGDAMAREVVILRPDRYVAATCRREDLNAVTRRFRSLISVPGAEGMRREARRG